MKLIQINAWCGRLNGPLAELIAEEQPDLVCMQEAFAPKSRVLEVFKDQYGFTDEIIEKGAFGHQFFARTWSFSIGEATIDVGNLILSKLPVGETQSFYTHGKYHTKTTDKAIRNTRVWQACAVELSTGQQLSLSNYQGYLTGSDPTGDETSVQTLEAVRDALAKLSHPLIFCGDLNVKISSEPIKVLDSLGLTSLTAQHKVATTLSDVHRAPKQDRESVACDYIYVSPDIQVTRFEVSDRIVSDHKALILEFDI